MIERTRMRSETPGTPGRKQHSPRTMRSMFTPAREARYSAWMMVGSGRALSFAMMREGEGRMQQLAQARHARESGQLQENLVNIFADRFVGRHQAVVGVEPRGL